MGKADKRSCRRFVAPGGIVSYRAEALIPFRQMAETACLLVDLSRGGASFIALRSVRPGRKLDLAIRFPDEGAMLRLRGKAVWCTKQPAGSYRVGVEFAPYGETASDNPHETLEQLIELEELCLSG